jgi:uncharacterized protein
VETLPTDHAGLAVLPRDECLDRLRHTRVGRVAFVENGEPVILPVNHEIDGETIVFRTASGSKLAAAASESPVAFEVDGFDADRRAGWSVVVRGTAALITDDAEVRRLRTLGVWPWADAAERPHWVRVRPYEITGRQIVHPAPDQSPDAGDTAGD